MAVTAAENLPDLAGGVAMSDASACIVTTSTPGSDPSEPGPALTYRWRSYDEHGHILRDVAFDEDGQLLPLASATSPALYLKLNETGRTLVRASEAGGGALERSDYRRDSHGNVISQRQARTRTRDLAVAFPEEPSEAHDFLNKYDAAGLLRSHDRTDSGLSFNYRHDASGRCEYIFDAQHVERLEYDERGRLGFQYIDPAPDLAPASDGTAQPSSVLITHRYDAQDRPLSVEQDGERFGAQPLDGQPELQTTWSYEPDGSVQIEIIDFTSTTPNAAPEQAGEPRNARRQTELWSPGCAALDAALPSRSGQECVAD